MKFEQPSLKNILWGCSCKHGGEASSVYETWGPFQSIELTHESCQISFIFILVLVICVHARFGAHGTGSPRLVPWWSSTPCHDLLVFLFPPSHV